MIDLLFYFQTLDFRNRELLETWVVLDLWTDVT